MSENHFVVELTPEESRQIEQGFVTLGIQPYQEELISHFHFDYIRPDVATAKYIEKARNQYKSLLKSLHTIPPSRERSLAITELETSLMFATKAIVVASGAGKFVDIPAK